MEQYIYMIIYFIRVSHVEESAFGVHQLEHLVVREQIVLEGSGSLLCADYEDLLALSATNPVRKFKAKICMRT